MKSMKKGMRRNWFRGEILCLFFIVSLAMFSGKIIINVRDSVGAVFSELNVKEEKVGYQVYSHKMLESVEGVKEVNVISSADDLDDFKELLDDNEIDIKWLNEKIKNYDNDDEYFEENSIIILCINYSNNVSLIRINDLYKSNDRIIIELKETLNSKEQEDIHTWFSFIEINDKSTDVDLNIIES